MANLRYCKNCQKQKSANRFHKTTPDTCMDCDMEIKRHYRARYRNPAQKNGFVYFVYAKEVNRVKIGVTIKDVHNRLKAIQGQSPCTVVLLGYFHSDTLIETELHHRFKKYHHHNEWFDLSDEIRDFIRQHCIN